METLLRITWRRGEQVFKPEKQDSFAMPPLKTDGGGASPVLGSSSMQKPAQRPPGGGESALRQILQRYPEGVHAIHSAPNLNDMLLKGEFQQAAQVASPGLDGTGGATESSGVNVPPAPLSPRGTAPVQNTLVSVNTYNHLSVYVVVHQDGLLLHVAPAQTLSASTATRKITAQMLFMLGCEEVRHPPGGDSADSMARLSEFPSIPGVIGGKDKGGRSAAHERDRIILEDIYITRPEDQDFFFNPQHNDVHFIDSNAKRKTISVANFNLVLEPFLIFGNQNGDIFIFSILEKRIVQRLNFNAGTSETHSSMTGGAGVKLISSAVSCLQEVQNGIEKELLEITTRAGVAKRARWRHSQHNDALPTDERPVGPPPPVASSYHAVHPSIFAAGFDNGQILLLCVVSTGAWLLRHFDAAAFGFHAIRAIAPRVPAFFARLWGGEAGARVRAEAALFADEAQQVAGLACDGGTVALVRLPRLDVLARVRVYEYHAVGEIVALGWAASAAGRRLAPDLLVSSSEDDTLSVFRIAARGGGADGLELLHRRRAHRSWVSGICTLPLIAPPRLGREGAPDFLGCCLVATSYDTRTSFWPILADAQEEEGGVALAKGPTASLRLHTDMTTASGVGGGGTSFFLITTCCRGKVKFWSTRVK